MNNFISRDKTIEALQTIVNKIKNGQQPDIEEYGWIVYTLERYIHILGKRKQYTNKQKLKQEDLFKQNLLKQIGIYKQSNEIIEQQEEEQQEEE